MQWIIPSLYVVGSQVIVNAYHTGKEIPFSSSGGGF